MIWSVRQTGVDRRILGIVNERTYLEALSAAEARYGVVRTHPPMTISLVVEPGDTASTMDMVTYLQGRGA